MDDSALIARHLDEGSEEAFAELVRRHYGLVLSVAFRRLGDRAAAADAAQAVFVLLAAQARRLRGRASLAGWLHQAAVLKAREHARAEARRRAREQHAAMDDHDAPDDSQAVWDQLAPLLDEALDALKPTDREAILLRFFHNRGLREVGEALGLQEDAARKRVARAVEALRTWFQRRGVVAPAAVLTATITARAIEPFLPEAAAGAAGIALRSAAVAPLSPLTQLLLLMTPVKTGLILGGLAVAVLLVTTRRDHPHAPETANAAPAPAAAAGAGRDSDGLRRASAWVRSAGPGRAADPALEAQLSRLRAALFQRGDAAAAEARKTLEEIPLKQRGAALGLIGEALNHADLEICRRGVALLPLVWPDGEAALPRLWDLLATRGDESPALAGEIMVSALQVAAYPGTVQELAAAALLGSDASRSSLDLQLPLLRTLVPQSDDTWRSSLQPFLYSPDASQRLAAAIALAQVPGAADPTTVSTLAQALANAGAPGAGNPQAGSLLAALSALGPGAAAAVPALQQYAASHPEAADLVNLTLKAISPSEWTGVAPPSPLPPADSASTALLQGVADGSVSLQQLVSALGNPDTTLAAARALADLGTNAASALPALGRALSQAAGGDPATAYVLAAAMERLDPTSPKPLVPFADLTAGLTAVEAAAKGDAGWQSAITGVVQNSTFRGVTTLSQVSGFAAALGRIDPSLRTAFVGALLNADQRYQQIFAPTP